MSYWGKWRSEQPSYGAPRRGEEWSTSAAKRPKLEHGSSEELTPERLEKLEDEVEYFLAAHEVDEKGMEMLRRAEPKVKLEVLDQGDLSSARNQTAALIGRLRRAGCTLPKGSGRGRSSAEVPDGIEAEQLVEKVKELQKTSEECKNFWWTFITKRGTHGKRDPAFYKKELLWEFLEQAGEEFGLPTLVGLEVSAPPLRNEAVVLKNEDGTQVVAPRQGWGSHDARSGAFKGKGGGKQEASAPPKPQLMWRGKLVQKTYEGWEEAQTRILQVPDPRGPAVRTDDVKNLLTIQKTKIGRDMVRCPLCKRGNKNGGSTCGCFQDPINYDMLQAPDVDALLERCGSQIEFGFKSPNVAMALALLARQVEPGSTLGEDPRVQKIVARACDQDIIQDYTRVNMVRVISAMSKIGATGDCLSSLATAAASTVSLLKSEDVAILARDIERLMGERAADVLLAVADRCWNQLNSIGIHLLCIVVTALIRCYVPATEFLEAAATAMASSIDEFDPHFLAWLIQKYAEYGIDHPVLNAAAVKAKEKFPLAFVPGAADSYSTFLLQRGDRGEGNGLRTGPKGSGKGKGK